MRSYMKRALALALVSTGLNACVSPNNPNGLDPSKASGAAALLSAGGTGQGLDTSPPPMSSVDPTISDKAPAIVAPVCSVDKFKQDEEEIRKVDILFVMDNSGSMGDDWERVANNIREMVRQIPSDVDVRYGIILGHVGAMRGKLYSSGKQRVLSNLSLSTEQIGSQLYDSFKAGMKVADEGSGEATFYSLYYAVTQNLAENQKLGFFRPDATLETIFVSDEQEIGSPFPAVQAGGLPPRCDAAFEDGVKKEYYDKQGITVDVVYAAVKAAKGDMAFGAHAIVNITAEDLFKNNSRTAKCLYDSLGYGYFDIVKKSGGVLYSIQKDTAAALAQIGIAVRKNLELNHEFKLSKPSTSVDPVTLLAKVDGIVKSFTYDAAASLVRLPDAGKAGSQIAISYCEPVAVVTPPTPNIPVPPVVSVPVPTTPAEPAPVPTTPAPAPVPDPGSQWQVAGFDGTTATNIANLIWQTQATPTKAKIFVGLSADNLSHRVTAVNEFKAVHFVTEDGLEPNTRYYFKVISTDQAGKTSESNVISKKTKE